MGREAAAAAKAATRSVEKFIEPGVCFLFLFFCSVVDGVIVSINETNWLMREGGDDTTWTSQVVITQTKGRRIDGGRVPEERFKDSIGGWRDITK